MQFNRKDIKWTVDKENRVIEARYVFDRNEAAEELENIMRKAFSHQNMFVPVSEVVIGFPNDYTVLSATAKCHPDDEFDVQKGMQICYYRLLRRFYEEKHSLTTQYADIVSVALDRYLSTLRSLECGYAKVTYLLNNCEWDKTEAELLDVPEFVLTRLSKRTLKGDLANHIRRDGLVQRLKERLQKAQNANVTGAIPPLPLPKAGKRTFVKGGVITKEDK